MNRRLRWAIGLSAAAGLALSFWLFRVGPDVEVAVPKGAGAAEIASLLHREGVVASPLLFKAFAKLSGFDRSLKPGTYALRRSMSSLEALWRIQRGGLDYIRVTIPEGWRATQTAARLDALGVTDGDAFMDVVMDRNWEGYIFPTTYFLSAGMPAAKVAVLMHDEFRRRIAPLLTGVLPSPLTAAGVVTLAAIVEREAVLHEERPMIAAVYLNRLRRGWPLEADPTVQYALGYWKKNLRYKHLEVASPYNTYRNKGLPPGPICSPGLGSVQAVLKPAQTEAMYFVADNTGGHKFSTTFQEHQLAKQKAKAERRRQQRRLSAQSAR